MLAGCILVTFRSEQGLQVMLQILFLVPQFRPRDQENLRRYPWSLHSMYLDKVSLFLNKTVSRDFGKGFCKLWNQKQIWIWTDSLLPATFICFIKIKNVQSWKLKEKNFYRWSCETKFDCSTCKIRGDTKFDWS